MIREQVILLFLRGIPEQALFLIGILIVSGTKFGWKKYLAANCIYLIIPLLIRLLPIQFGINSILSLVLLIILSVYIYRITILKSIQSCILVFITEFTCELLNIVSIKYLFKSNVNYAFRDSISKAIYGMPSLVLFAIILLVIYKVKKIHFIRIGAGSN